MSETEVNLTTVNTHCQLGLITPVGFLVKNGILIVEFANQLEIRGLSRLAAIREASLTRPRPSSAISHSCRPQGLGLQPLIVSA
ncbi:MAG TPA: efflux RND transporter permease subunit [Nitrospira sp.]|nr:efflux RND transporter permease subunit [Nitrospira sp.]